MSTPSVLLALVLVGGCRTKGDDSALPGDSVATEDSSGADSDAPIDADGDGVFAEDDCDDADPTVFPGATELCGGVDEDCDGQVDEDAADAATWYGDGDGDGYGDDRVQSLACEAPEGYVAEAGDCEDGDAAYYPGAPEDDCTDPADYNCDGSVGYADADGDGWAACEDCDDGARAVNPTATELCDGVDNDCDGDTDEADAADAGTWYGDGDGDGYGDASDATVACEAPEGYVADDEDCEDGDAAVNPGATELCDGVDNDCDGAADEDDASDATTWYLDFDSDGYGGATYSQTACDAPSGYVSSSSDCDDADSAIHPGASELCDGVDNDCDGQVDPDSQVLGDGALCPADSCDALLTARSGAGDGAWWVDPDGAGAFEVYCDMSTQGGGWTLAAKLTNQDSRHWTTAASDWTGTTAYGDTDDLSAGADAKGEAWGRLQADELLLTDDANFGYIATNDGCLRGYTPADFFTLALASFPYSGDSYFDTCTLDRSGFPTWAAEPDWGSHDSSSTDLSLQDNYLVIARTDGGADTSGVVSFYKTSYGEADVGLGALESGTTWTNDGYSQDIGGPTSCSYSDSECASEYPETVYLWVR
ncbi:MAG: hypothetical protein H6741_34420 [Alphaproteobacteria bacterium]|nr:hypothetical protein [Alphaproteobacteria bacterium]